MDERLKHDSFEKKNNVFCLLSKRTYVLISLHQINVCICVSLKEISMRDGEKNLS